MPRKILVLQRRGSFWNCWKCGEEEGKPSHVVHDNFKPYEPTDAEIDTGYIPYEKTCRETFLCKLHYNMDYLNNPEKYNDPETIKEQGGIKQSNFTSSTLDDYRRKGQNIFIYDEE